MIPERTLPTIYYFTTDESGIPKDFFLLDSSLKPNMTLSSKVTTLVIDETSDLIITTQTHITLVDGVPPYSQRHIHTTL